MKKKLLSIALSAAVVFTFSFGSVGSAFAATENTTNYALKAGNNYYDTFKEALENESADPLAITLLKDVNEGFLHLKKDVELDLDGRTLTASVTADADKEITVTSKGKIAGEAADGVIVNKAKAPAAPVAGEICVNSTGTGGNTVRTYAVHGDSAHNVVWDIKYDKYGRPDAANSKVSYAAYCDNCATAKDKNDAAIKGKDIKLDDTTVKKNVIKEATHTVDGSIMFEVNAKDKTSAQAKDTKGKDLVIKSEVFTVKAVHEGNVKDVKTAKEPTCFETGLERGYCEECKSDFTNVLVATGNHVYKLPDKAGELDDSNATYDFDKLTITRTCTTEGCTHTDVAKAVLTTDTLTQSKTLHATLDGKEYKKTKFSGSLETMKTYNDVTVELSDDFKKAAYTGKEIVADDSKKDIKVTITSGTLKQELEEGVDYTVSYENNLNATPKKDGKTVEDKKQWAQVVITGKGDFSGTVKEAFKIEKGVLTADDANFGSLNQGLESSVYGKNHEVDINGAVVLKLNDEVVTDDAILKTMTVENLPAKNAAVGKYKVTVKVPETDNYSEYSGVLTYNVRPADLLVKIQDASRAYGKANPKFEFTTSGLVSGDNIDDLVKITTKAKKSSKVGKYNIVGTVLDSDAANNYNITFDTAKLTVTKATQAITKAKTKATVKKGKSFKIAAKTTSGKVSYKKVSGNKNITVNKYGKVTAKKAIKKGTYKIKVKITAPSTANYKAKAVTKTITVKVK